jgi:predicted dehydrogenase
MKKLKIGVLGVSNHFVKRIVLPLQETKYCYIHGIASRDAGKALSASKKYNIPKSYFDADNAFPASLDAIP